MRDVDEIEIEVTDTFGGEANYSWVRREKIRIQSNATRAQITRAVKRATGYSGVPCRSEYFGDCGALYPRGACIAIFWEIKD
jgi:hypothetical protein